MNMLRDWLAEYRRHPLPVAAGVIVIVLAIGAAGARAGGLIPPFGAVPSGQVTSTQPHPAKGTAGAKLPSLIDGPASVRAPRHARSPHREVTSASPAPSPAARTRPAASVTAVASPAPATPVTASPAPTVTPTGSLTPAPTVTATATAPDSPSPSPPPSSAAVSPSVP